MPVLRKKPRLRWLIYLPGWALCYMTQLGRYAHITKQALEGYQIIQENVYTIEEGEDGTEVGHAHPFDTQVFYAADEADEVAQKTLSMGERTCFLHAAMRDSYPSNIQVQLNGEDLPLE